MPKPTRRVYEKSFKQDAVRLVLEGQSIPSVADSLGLPYSTVKNWVNLHHEKGKHAFLGRGKAHQDEMIVLKKNLKKAEMERNILKKALAFFSKNP